MAILCTVIALFVYPFQKIDDVIFDFSIIRFPISLVFNISIFKFLSFNLSIIQFFVSSAL